MGKPATSILSCNQIQCLADRFLQCFSCASRSPTQRCLQLGEGLPAWARDPANNWAKRAAGSRELQWRFAPWLPYGCSGYPSPRSVQLSVVAQSRRMAPITGNHFHKLREGIIRLENENRSFLIEPLPGIDIGGRVFIAPTPTAMTAIVLFARSGYAHRAPAPRIHSGDRKG